MLPLTLLFLIGVTACVAVDLKAVRKELMGDESLMATLDSCLSKQSMKREDLEKLDRSSEDILEKLNCVSKCMQEENGIIDSNGTINMDKIANMPFFAHFKDEEKSKILECVKKIEKIETCSDINKMHECVKPFLQ